jgi:hypothetical protein
MSVEVDFRRRITEVSFFLRSLRDIEKRQLKNNKLFYRAPSALAVSRASSFIMIYNCVEYAAKQSLAEIKREAASGDLLFGELVEYWQDEIIKARFGPRLSSGMNHEIFLLEVRKSIPAQVTWLKDTPALPFSGNINHERLIDFAKKIGVNQWKPPKSSLGGSDLELIRKNRNDLAHGDETFESVGGQYSIDDIYSKLDRIRSFMCSYIRMMERYKLKGRYKLN